MPAQWTSSAWVTAVVCGKTIEKRAPDAGFGMDFDAAADGCSFALHHVHADATAGDFGQLLGGREAGRENQVGQRCLVICLLRLQHAKCQALVRECDRSPVRRRRRSW